MKLITIPVIVLICYVLGEIIKILFQDKTKVKQLIPFIMSITGGIVSILMYMLNAPFLELTNIWDAVLIGMVSGLASTGTNETIKKFKEIKGEKNEKSSL